MTAAGEAFGRIVTAMEEMNGQVEQMSHAASALRRDSRQVTETVEAFAQIAADTSGQTQNVAAATEQQAAAMQQIARSTELLHQLAQGLQKAVERFRY